MKGKRILFLTEKELEELYNVVPKTSRFFHKINMEYKAMKGIPVNGGVNL